MLHKIILAGLIVVFGVDTASASSLPRFNTKEKQLAYIDNLAKWLYLQTDPPREDAKFAIERINIAIKFCQGRNKDGEPNIGNLICNNLLEVAQEAIAKSTVDYYTHLKSIYSQEKDKKNNPYNMPSADFKDRVDAAVLNTITKTCGLAEVSLEQPVKIANTDSSICADALNKLDKIVQVCVVATKNEGCDIALNVLEIATNTQNLPTNSRDAVSVRPTSKQEKRKAVILLVKPKKGSDLGTTLGGHRKKKE